LGVEEIIFIRLKESMISLDKDRVVNTTRAALDKGYAPQDIIGHGLLEGLRVIGEDFTSHNLFLPELIAAADSMQAAFDVVRPYLGETDGGSQGTVLLGTVQGDIHDIGKNIVGTLLAANGFVVHDLGVDVRAETFVREAQTLHPDIVALSALLAGAVSKMAETISLLKEHDVDAKIVIGGAATSQAVADYVGADGYGKDAWHGVQKVKQLVETGRQ
jgi:5-methyltetrahydrofolate--homocysteine methyltransferase